MQSSGYVCELLDEHGVAVLAQRDCASPVLALHIEPKGLIALRVDRNDRRVKFVEPTQKSKDYMREIGRSLDATFGGESTA